MHLFGVWGSQIVADSSWPALLLPSTDTASVRGKKAKLFVCILEFFRSAVKFLESSQVIGLLMRSQQTTFWHRQPWMWCTFYPWDRNMQKCVPSALAGCCLADGEVVGSAQLTLKKQNFRGLEKKEANRAATQLLRAHVQVDSAGMKLFCQLSFLPLE